MRLFSSYSYKTLSNSYLLGPDSPGDAVLIDPSVFDTDMLDLVESHGYYVKSVLLTHCDESHLDGLRTLQRVYDCSVYAARSTILHAPANPVSNGEQLDICCSPIKVIGLPGHGRDSVSFLVEGFLFSGVAMSAAESGPVANSYARAVLLQNIAERILTLPPHVVILPFYGPPSTVGVELRTFPVDSQEKPARPM